MGVDYDINQLDQMTRKDLQQLSKACGIKANGKVSTPSAKNPGPLFAFPEEYLFLKYFSFFSLFFFYLFRQCN